MAAGFVAASSQRLKNTAIPLVSTGYPCTAAALVLPASAASNLTVVSIADTGSANNRLLGGTATSSWNCNAQAGGTTDALTFGTVTAGQWAFVVWRFISATNRRGDVLHYDGSTAHAQSTVNRGPTSIDTIAVGANETSSPTNFFDGSIAEFWYTATDIQPGGAALDDNLLRQLARFGPFSVPTIGPTVIEYHSYFQGIDSTMDIGPEVYAKLRQTWTNVNGVTRAPHPPLIGYLRNTRRMGGMKIV
jgi:hypothetical protein